MGDEPHENIEAECPSGNQGDMVTETHSQVPTKGEAEFETVHRYLVRVSHLCHYQLNNEISGVRKKINCVLTLAI